MKDDQEKDAVFKKQRIYMKYLLVLFNILLILAAIIFSWHYSRYIEREQEKAELDAFGQTVDAMKQISDNYLRMEQGYARDWAKYINQEDMTVDQALAYINKCNHQEDRYAHIVDMDTFEAYSTYRQGTDEPLSCYQDFYDRFQRTGDETYQLFMETMQKMFSEDDALNILGKYRTDDTQANVISVGTRVSLLTDEGTKKDYLLLCVIPVESIRKIWIFPVEYRAAEVGIITKSGAYVIPSQAMKSLSFSEFVWSYNFSDDFGKVQEMLDQLASTDKGIFACKDSRGQDCYWYYSSFGDDSTLDIMGYIPVQSLIVQEASWLIVFVICVVLMLLTIMDGLYFIHINKRLRSAVQTAEEASQAKTRFLSTMSHDIRTPMNGIIGMTNMAKAHLDDTAYARECLDKVSLTSDHLLTLINDILDISKVESGGMMLNPAVFSLEETLEKLFDIVQIQMEEKQLHFEKHTELPKPYLIADELRLNQIFINILTNAIKYTAKGGHIRMDLCETMLPDEKVRLMYRVTDDGMGMSEEFQKNMYHMFNRESDSRIDKIQGTGLGLAIVKEMVELMGGTIRCESKVDQGTTFTITVDLPCSDEKTYREKYGKDDDAEDRFDDLKVLVAEDNDLNWEICSELLHTLGIDADRAVNGQVCIQMLEAAESVPYDLVFMDVQMPVMNGKEATREIRKSERAYMRDMMICAMTADAFAEDIRECEAVGMNGHIAKPIEAKKVREVLRKAEKRKRNKG